MSIQIKEISAQELQRFYNQFQGEKTFLQSSQYGEWRKAIKETILYYGIHDGNNIIGTALIQKIKSLGSILP